MKKNKFYISREYVTYINHPDKFAVNKYLVKKSFCRKEEILSVDNIRKYKFFKMYFYMKRNRAIIDNFTLGYLIQNEI